MLLLLLLFFFYLKILLLLSRFGHGKLNSIRMKTIGNFKLLTASLSFGELFNFNLDSNEFSFHFLTSSECSPKFMQFCIDNDEYWSEKKTLTKYRSTMKHNL